MRFRYLFLLFIFVMAFSGIALAQTNVIENSGFVPDNLWFSKAPSAIGEKVEVYTLVWNASSNDISGTVSFFDNDSVIDKKSFILAGEGSSRVLSVPWIVKEGYHKIYAQITDSAGAPRGKSAIAVFLQYAKTSEAEQFIGAPIATSSSPGATVGNFVSNKVGFAKDYATANLPAPVVGSTKTTANILEAARTGAANWGGQAVTQLKKDLQTKSESTDKEKPSGFSVDGPLKYAEIFLLSVVSFVFGNPWIFYTLLVAVIFFILRFIKRKFFF